MSKRMRFAFIRYVFNDNNVCWGFLLDWCALKSLFPFERSSIHENDFPKQRCDMDFRWSRLKVPSTNGFCFFFSSIHTHTPFEETLRNTLERTRVASGHFWRGDASVSVSRWYKDFQHLSRICSVSHSTFTVLLELSTPPVSPTELKQSQKRFLMPYISASLNLFI